MASQPDRSDEVRSLTRIVLRPIGSALPLGFYAFGVGLLLVSAIELHWITAADAKNVPLVLLAFVAPLELIGSAIAFLARDTGAATALGVFALSWVAQALVYIRQAQQPSVTLGLLFAMMVVILAALAVVSYAGKPLLSFIIAVAALRTVAATLVEFKLHQFGTLSAVLGIALAVLSLYGGTAFLIEDAKQSAVLPIFRRGAALEAIEGGLNDQIKKMPNEPGVRQQL
jgi:hypothetical protein